MPRKLTELEIALIRDAYRTGRCDGRWGAKKSYGDWNYICCLEYNKGYAFGRMERAAEPWRYGD